MSLLQPVFLLLMIGSALAALASRDLMVSTIVFGVFSFFAAAVYVLMGAPDVAFVEAVIGGVTTIFYVTVIFQTRRRTSA